MKLITWLVWTLSAWFAQDRRESAVSNASLLRAQGPAALERLLQRYDALGGGPEKDALERTIDAVAGQRYANVSRLYWYTDLDAAREAALATGKPILSLRMLGRLDQDLSCANSRLFRVVLYADEAVSRLLREEFVLHWQSERSVPRVSVEFDDGRRIETTLGGNSVHYVLDADLRPIDALPGLYGPGAFRRELEASLPLARRSPSLADAERTAAVKEFHRSRLLAAQSLWNAKGAEVVVAVSDSPGIAEAEVVAVTKAAMELPLVKRAGLAALPEGLRPSVPARIQRPEESRLGEQSRALVRRLAPTDWGRPCKSLDAAGIDQLIANLEVLLALDTERNELQRHEAIHAWLSSGEALPGLAALNERVYRELFRTPADDPWLGLSGLGVFTGLPHDGLSD